MTTPVTNSHFRDRVFQLVSDHLATLEKHGQRGTSILTASQADPILPPLTPDDTALYPSAAVNTYTGYISPWIDLTSANPVIATISRQVLNLEVNYANFCGVRSLIIPGPSRDASMTCGHQGLAQYSRAVSEALTIGSRLNFLVHMSMYREPNVGRQIQTLSSLQPQADTEPKSEEIDIFTTWDSWHHIRTVCEYNMRLSLGKSTGYKAMTGQTNSDHSVKDSKGHA